MWHEAVPNLIYEIVSFYLSSVFAGQLVEAAGQVFLAVIDRGETLDQVADFQAGEDARVSIAQSNFSWSTGRLSKRTPTAL
jgi:hypothetical protein